MADAFSFCIYGDDAKYYRGLEENLALIESYYPSWKTYVWVGADRRNDLIGPMLARYNKNVLWIETHARGPVNMIFRFFTIDDPAVATMHVRDADSRVHARDRWCINEFMASSDHSYTIRDNPSHTALVMGGLWGCRKLPVKIWNVFHMISRDFMSGPRPEMGYDQTFLGRWVHPLLVRGGFVVFTNYVQVAGEKVISLPGPAVLPASPFCGQPE